MKVIRKIFKYASIAISVLIFLFAIIIVLLSVQAKKENKMMSFFGHSYSVVASPSMEPKIMTKEIIVIKRMNYDSYLENAKVNEDVLVYYSEINRRFIVHELYEIREDGLLLKGVNNDSPDLELVTKDNFVGKVVLHGGAWFGSLLIGSRFIIIFVLLLFLIFIILSEVLKVMLKKDAKNPKFSKSEEEKIRQEILEEIARENKQ
ncbi:MAG: signal peptidase I [Acholeplasmatales bacterium]